MITQIIDGTAQKIATLWENQAKELLSLFEEGLGKLSFSSQTKPLVAKIFDVIKEYKVNSKNEPLSNFIAKLCYELYSLSRHPHFAQCKANNFFFYAYESFKIMLASAPGSNILEIANNSFKESKVSKSDLINNFLVEKIAAKGLESTTNEFNEQLQNICVKTLKNYIAVLDKDTDTSTLSDITIKEKEYSHFQQSIDEEQYNRLKTSTSFAITGDIFEFYYDIVALLLNTHSENESIVNIAKEAGLQAPALLANNGLEEIKNAPSHPFLNTIATFLGFKNAQALYDNYKGLIIRDKAQASNLEKAYSDFVQNFTENKTLEKLQEATNAELARLEKSKPNSKANFAYQALIYTLTSCLPLNLTIAQTARQMQDMTKIKEIYNNNGLSLIDHIAPRLGYYLKAQNRPAIVNSVIDYGKRKLEDTLKAQTHAILDTNKFEEFLKSNLAPISTLYFALLETKDIFKDVDIACDVEDPIGYALSTLRDKYLDVTQMSQQDKSIFFAYLEKQYIKGLEQLSETYDNKDTFADEIYYNLNLTKLAYKGTAQEKEVNAFVESIKSFLFERFAPKTPFDASKLQGKLQDYVSKKHAYQQIFDYVPPAKPVPSVGKLFVDDLTSYFKTLLHINEVEVKQEPSALDLAMTSENVNYALKDVLLQFIQNLRLTLDTFKFSTNDNDNISYFKKLKVAKNHILHLVEALDENTNDLLHPLLELHTQYNLLSDRLLNVLPLAFRKNQYLEKIADQTIGSCDLGKLKETLLLAIQENDEAFVTNILNCSVTFSEMDLNEFLNKAIAHNSTEICNHLLLNYTFNMKAINHTKLLALPLYLSDQHFKVDQSGWESFAQGWRVASDDKDILEQMRRTYVLRADLLKQCNNAASIELAVKNTEALLNIHTSNPNFYNQENKNTHLYKWMQVEENLKCKNGLLELKAPNIDLPTFTNLRKSASCI